MKKSLGVLIVAVCFFFAGFFSVFKIGFGSNNSSSIKNIDISSVNASDGYFSGMNTQFRLFDDTNGVFILKEDGIYDDLNESFSSGVLISANSGVNDLGQAYSDLYSDWRYEAVVWRTEINTLSGDNWHPTVMLDIHVNAGRKSVTYSLPRAASADKYGIRVTAYSSGNPVYDSRGRLVSSVFIIMYAEELSYMYCADTNGSMVYNVLDRGNGLDRVVQVGVYVNPGAVKQSILQPEYVDGFRLGNLTLDAGLSVSSLNWHLEDALGNRFSEYRVVPKVEVVNGVFEISFPKENFWNGNYVLRVYHDVNDEVYGTYVINYGGTYKAAGAGLGDLSSVILILGLVLCVGFGIMYMLPRMAVRVNEVQYNANERKRFRKRSKDVLTAEFEGSGKRALNKDELASLSDAEKEELFKQRMKDAKQTKSSTFLNKMAENRQKRELARDVGMSMDEFKEIEDKLKKTEGAKEIGLAAFRKAVEEKTGIITQRQEEEIEESKKQAQVSDARPKRSLGEPEFDLLDSVKDSEDAIKEIKETAGDVGFASVIAPPISGAQKWKQVLLDDGGISSIVDRDAVIKTREHDENNNSKEKSGTSAESFDINIEKIDIPEEKVEIPEKKPENTIGGNPEEKKKESSGMSILQRLRRLAGEDTE